MGKTVIGTSDLSDLYCGDTEVTVAYLGDTEIWSKGGSYPDWIPAQSELNRLLGQYAANNEKYIVLVIAYWNGPGETNPYTCEAYIIWPTAVQTGDSAKYELTNSGQYSLTVFADISSWSSERFTGSIFYYRYNDTNPHWYRATSIPANEERVNVMLKTTAPGAGYSIERSALILKGDNVTYRTTWDSSIIPMVNFEDVTT